MTLSSAALKSALAFETDEVWLCLLKIEHESLDEVIRVVNNTENITSNGEEYIAFPFELTLPEESQDTPGQAKVRIDNVDRRIVEVIRLCEGVPTMTISVILADSPDVVEFGPLIMNLTGVEYDSLIVDATVTYDDVLNQSFPKDRFTPSLFRGMF